MFFLIVSIIYLLLSLVIVNTPLSDKFFLPSIYRNISIPIYYWLTAIAYLLIRARIFKEDKSIKTFLYDCFAIGLPLHLYFLLGNLLSQLSGGSLLSAIYVCYILMIAFLFSIFLALLGASKFNNIPLLLAPVSLSVLFLFQAHYFESCLIISALAVGLLLTRWITISFLANILKRFYTNKRLLILTIFIFAFIIRYAFAVNIILKTGDDYSTGHSFTQASDDGPTYDDIGKRLMKDFSSLFRGEIPLWGHWDYVYGIFLGVIYSIFGRNFYIATLFQALLGSLIPVLLFLIGEIEFSKRAGLIASLITSMNEPLIFLSTVYGHEVISLPTLIFLVFLMVKINRCEEQQKRRKMIIMAGLFLGILVLVRSVYAYFFLFLAVWFLFFRKVKLLNRIIEILVISILACLVVVGTFKITANSLKLSTVRISGVWTAERTYPPFTNISNRRLIAMGVDPFVAGMEKSVAVIIRHPFAFLRLLIELLPLRVIAYFEVYQFGYFDPIYMVNNAKIPARFPSNLEFYTSLFFLTGLIILIRNHKIFSSPFFLPLFYNVFVYGIVFAQQVPRFRESSIPFIYTIGAVGISYFWGLINSRKKVTLIG
ncbi:MAG: glycosyltransferase family 39 protein [Candidatus Omnitrophica bacterium]|nr:glycosyltransferase family 39 protein [Candidatus Omnitrophota bacterium]